MWYVRAIHNGGYYVDEFPDLASASRWAEDLCVAYGWDFLRGDRQTIERVAR